MKKRIPKRIIADLLLCLLFLALAPSALAQEDALYFGGGEFDNMSHVLQLPDGNIVLSLSTHIREDGKTPLPRNTANGSLLCIGQDGKLHWQLHVGVDGKKSIFAGCTQLSDGTLLASLHQYSEDNYGGDNIYLLMRVSPEGEILGEVAIPKNFSLIFPAKEGFITVNQEGAKGHFTHISADNTVNWNLTTHRDLISMNASVLPAEDGMVAIGRVLDSTGGITKLDEVGRVLWEMSLAENGVSMLDFGTIASNGDIVAAGHRISEEQGNQVGEPRGVVARADKNGRPLWEKEFELLRSSNLFEGVLEIPQGTLVFGIIKTDTRLKFYLLDEQGNETASWEDYTEDEVYRSGRLCLIAGEAWVCLNVDKDNRSYIELRRVILPK